MSLSLSAVVQLNDPESFLLGKRWRIALIHCHPHPCLFPPHHSRPAPAAGFHFHFHPFHSPHRLSHSLQQQRSLFTLPPLFHTAQQISFSKDKTYSASVKQTYLIKMTLLASTGCIRGVTCYRCSPFPK